MAVCQFLQRYLRCFGVFYNSNDATEEVFMNKSEMLKKEIRHSDCNPVTFTWICLNKWALLLHTLSYYQFNFKLQHVGNRKIVKRYNFILAIICGFNSPQERKSTCGSYNSSNINTISNFNAFQYYWCISYDKLQTSICQEKNNIQ